MAANDLTNELLASTTDPQLNDNTSSKIVEAVLNLLQDKNGEVQNMGVKWYSGIFNG
jgi:2C-methyl-D-erythritol 2,4-cyclodiphosphate synthase